MKIHTFILSSKVNGPGNRFVLWVQGCSRGCIGCFNPLTHNNSKGIEMSITSILHKIPLEEVSGITISGGEPFEQAEDLAQLLLGAKRLGLHCLVYTGFLFNELKMMNKVPITRCLEKIDMLIDGDYKEGSKRLLPWAGSGNQRILKLKQGEIYNILEKKDFSDSEINSDAEICIDIEGNIIATGIFDTKLI